MCGRYAFDDIREIYKARKIIEEAAARLGEPVDITTGEVAPTDPACVLVQTQTGYVVDVMRWGYPMRDTKRIIINARGESVFEKPMFSRSLQNKKCLIPCTGFFEWRKSDREKFIIMPQEQRFFYMAGLYNVFRKADRRENRFVIVTVPANAAMKAIHERMPLIVPMDEAGAWLKKGLKAGEMDHIRRLTEKLDILAV